MPFCDLDFGFCALDFGNQHVTGTVGLSLLSLCYKLEVCRLKDVVIYQAGRV